MLNGFKTVSRRNGPMSWRCPSCSEKAPWKADGGLYNGQTKKACRMCGTKPNKKCKLFLTGFWEPSFLDLAPDASPSKQTAVGKAATTARTKKAEAAVQKEADRVKKLEEENKKLKAAAANKAGKDPSLFIEPSADAADQAEPEEPNDRAATITAEIKALVAETNRLELQLKGMDPAQPRYNTYAALLADTKLQQAAKQQEKHTSKPPAEQLLSAQAVLKRAITDLAAHKQKFEDADAAHADAAAKADEAAEKYNKSADRKNLAESRLDEAPRLKAWKGGKK